MFSKVKSRMRVESQRAGSSATPAYPHPAFRIPHSAITLTEVLISMGILTLGLLGVAAMFPVGSYFMQKGDTANRASAVAQAAFNDIVTQGLLDPENWYLLLPGNAPNAASPPPITISPNYRFKSDPVDPSGGFLKFASTYTRPLAATLKEANALASTLSNKELVLSRHFGSAYVLDPLGVASFAILDDASGGPNRVGYAFPATANSSTIPVSVYSAYAAGWNQWKTWQNADASQDTWPVRRVTFHQANPFAALQYHEPMKVATAQSLFGSHDDLAIDMPRRDDMPSTQNWNVVFDSTGTPTSLSRQVRGDYSWIVTVVPKTVSARNALANGGDGHAYDVSVVVFHKRVLNRIDPVDSTASRAASDLLMQQERAVQARVLSTGPSGGELLLSAYDINSSKPDGLASPFTNLKVGQWIMLCGPHPQSTDNAPQFVLNWYRVLAIDGKDTKLDANGNPTSAANQPERRLVSVRGPQWPWMPDSPPYSSPLSNWLCVGIFPGAVAVHNKTIQLESNSSWSVD